MSPPIPLARAQSHLPVRAAGKVSLAMCSGKKTKTFGEYLASLPHWAALILAPHDAVAPSYVGSDAYKLFFLRR